MSFRVHPLVEPQRELGEHVDNGARRFDGKQGEPVRVRFVSPAPAADDDASVDHHVHGADQSPEGLHHAQGFCFGEDSCIQVRGKEVAEVRVHAPVFQGAAEHGVKP